MKKLKQPSKKICVVDCETDPFKVGRVPEPFIWGFYDGDIYEEFSTPLELITFLYDKDYIVYAHNGGKFDWHFILDFIEHFTPLLIINGRLSKFKIGQCEFRDSYNILPVPLSQMQKDVFDYTKLERENRDRYMDDIKKYLYNDCVYLYKYVMGFIDRFGLHLTQATAAMKVWEQITGNVAPHDSDGVIYDSFSKFYYGGRCQAFHSGRINEPFEMADINSAYPFAMLHEHPISLSYDSTEPENFLALPDDKKGACFLTLDADSAGAFPFRSLDNSLHFPDDGKNRLFNVTGWEYLAARDTGVLKNVKIHRAYIFSETINFKDYILHFYEERLRAKATGDKLNDLLSKLLMNSLYGKFGSNPRNYHSNIVIDPACLDDNGEFDPVIGREIGIEGRWVFAGELGNLTLAQRDIERYKERFYNVATAASITGFVRAYMWRALSKCQGVYYCDTDSIAARDVSGLQYGKALGEWEHEGNFLSGGVAGKKLYAFLKESGDYKIASKGARLTPDEILEICDGKEIIYQSESPIFSVHKQPTFIPRKIRKQKILLQEKEKTKPLFLSLFNVK